MTPWARTEHYRDTPENSELTGDKYGCWDKIPETESQTTEAPRQRGGDPHIENGVERKAISQPFDIYSLSTRQRGASWGAGLS